MVRASDGGCRVGVFPLGINVAGMREVATSADVDALGFCANIEDLKQIRGYR